MGIFNNKSNNPFLSEERFAKERRNNPTTSEFMVGAQAGTSQDVMTKSGAINKTVILTGIMLATAAYAFSNPSRMMMIGGAIAGLIMVIIASFKPQTSNITAPLYAAFEGLFVGAITAIYANAFSGIVFQAISVTICILIAMLMLYQSGLITVNNQFRKGVIAATLGVFLLYMLTWVLSFFGITMPYIHQGGPIGILISLAIVGIASLNLLLDFDMIDQGDQYGAPKYMEWFSGMAILITLVWIYVEVLRLLSYFRD